MFLTVHTAAGALIGEYAASPIWAFVFGFISHFILDMIPHGDYELFRKFQRREKLKRLVAIALIDSVIAIFFILFLYTGNILINPAVAAFGIAGAILPDLIVGIYELAPNRFLRKFFLFHKSFHFVFKKELPLSYGIMFQVLIWLFIRSRL